METTLSKKFFVDIAVSIKQKIKLLQGRRDNVIVTCPHCSSSTNGQEAITSIPPGDTEWWLKLLAICFSALQSANQCLQYKQTTNQNLPAMYYLFCFALMVAFVSFVLSKFVASSGSNLHYILTNFGLLFASISVFSTINMLFPFSVIFPGWAIFSITILIIVLCYCLPLDSSTQPSSSSADILPV
ncbi:hypothetical protein Leryth_002480 [Lithospermum erythrorhizon]|nr:hypothetical protein Leryth_002480 [Lithospermum erythrorhizon]